MYNLQGLNEAIRRNPQKLFSFLGTDFDIRYNSISSRCIIHDGDNRSAFTLYLDSGIWRCWTHGCHKIFGGDFVGFARGVLSRNFCQWKGANDDKVSFPQLYETLTALYSVSENTPQDLEKINRNKFFKRINRETITNDSFVCTLDKYLEETVESNYFLQRGFDEEILGRFYVRSCNRSNKHFSRRSLVPLFDVKDSRQIIGISGRLEFEGKPKWKHSKGYPGQTALYGLNVAIESLKTSKTAVIVEGPSDVWRLTEAGIPNAIGLNGLYLTAAKHRLLDQIGIMNIGLCLDNDEEGQTAANSITEEMGRLYNIDRILLPSERHDPAELSVSETKDIFGDYIQ